jgi:hypothetical protein
MKKILFILFCFPLITLAQLGSGGNNDGSYYYPREESVSDGGAYYDGGITHVVPFLYNGHNYPDSVYVSNPIVQGFASLTYSSPGVIDNVSLDIFPFVQITLDYTYNTNCSVKTYSILETIGGEGMDHSFTYDASDTLLIAKYTIVLPSLVEYKKTFTYSNGKLTQMDYFLLPDLAAPIQTDILTYNMSNQLQSIELSNGVKYEYGYNSVTNFCESVVMFYNNNYMDTVITREYDANGNMVKTSIKEFDLSVLPPTLAEHRIKIYSYDSYNRNIKEEDLDINTNQLNADYADYIYFTIPTGYNYTNACNSSTAIQEHTTNKELLKVTDLLGRETKGTKNEVLFYIYDNGTVEKRVIIE